jgi:hypothetical protein
MKLKPTFGFVALLLLTSAVAYAIHFAVLYSIGLNASSELLLLAYSVNVLLALCIGLGLYTLRRKYTESLGFIFMGGTALKFLVFFLFFDPVYSEDGEIERVEFLAFFIPYIICLIVETSFLVRVLNRAHQNR